MAERSEKARARQVRISKFNRSVRIRADVPEMRRYYDAISARNLNAKQKKQMKEAVRRARAIAAVQRAGGSGLYVDYYLRHFVQEYNGRIFQGEGLHMPTSFNILNAFIDPDEEVLVLKLLPQNENVISFNRMLDHITDPAVDSSIQLAARRMEDLTIYEINMLGGHAGFKIPSSEDYLFCGAAFCRENDEISLLGVFGRENPSPVRKRTKLDPADLYPGKEFLREMAEDLDLSDEALFGDEAYVPIILLARIDVKGGKVQARYVMEETKDVFHVISDDTDSLEYLAKSREAAPDIIQNLLDRLDQYSPLFELLFAVPCCLTLMDDDNVGLERHPTKLRLDPQSTDARMATSLPIAEAPKYVVVSTLFDLGEVDRREYEIKPSNLQIETSGYWRMLSLGQEGKDKVGNPIQGKTWVTTQKSWFEDQGGNKAPYERASPIEAAKMAAVDGYIYVMRNAIHGRDTYKVGFTTKAVEYRANQLGSTSGQPDIFNVVQSWRVKSPRLIEHEVHELLKEHRINLRREFFKLKYEKIREVIERVIDKADALLPDEE